MMEVVTCTTRQAVQIGEEIEITVVAIEPGRVRLGITAPGRTLTAITEIPLPVGASEINLMGLERGRNWPRGTPTRKK